MRKTERARRIVGTILVIVLLIALAALLISQPLKRQTVLIQTPSAYPYAATMYSYGTSYQVNGASITASPVSIDTCSSNFLGGVPPTFQSSDCSRYYGSDGTASVLYWGPGALNWTR